MLHDVGPNYLVMEFVEGTPLRGPLSLERALELAIQLADAIDAVLTALAVWVLKPPPVRPVTRTVIELGPGEHFASLDTPAVAISPDGANVVYAASRGSGPAQLFLRPLAALKAEPMAGTEDAAAPFFSPDGQWIAFFAGGKLKKSAVAGGAALTLYDTGSSVPGGTWGPNGTILCQPNTVVSPLIDSSFPDPIK